MVNYPNPFKDGTTISYNLPESSNVKLTVCNLLGEEIACLYNGFKEAGKHTEYFDAANINGNLLICKLELNNEVIISKLTIVK